MEKVDLARSAADLIAEYQRQPRQTPETIAQLPSYYRFIEDAERAGWTGLDIGMDEHFAERSAEWVASATEEERQRWLHTVLRAERWNPDCPMAVLETLRGGQLAAWSLAPRTKLATSIDHCDSAADNRTPVSGF